MGEGYPNDTALMEYVSSVNIACGYHAGDEATMRMTVKNAIKKGIAIGAHPGYHDRENFGRRPMTLSVNEIHDIVTDQIVKLRSIAAEERGKLTHVKPHGALYNQSAKDAAIAATIAQAVKYIDPDLIVFGLSGSLSISEAEKLGLRTASEVFADRTYQFDGSLTPRSEPNALIENKNAAAAQAFRMIANRNVVATDGSTVAIIADTICIHGDAPDALEFARVIDRELRRHDINISPV